MGKRLSENEWSEGVADIGPSLFRYFRAAGFLAAQASDMVQETLLRLVRKVNAGQFDPGHGTLRMYAFGIGRLVRFEAYRENAAGEWLARERDGKPSLPEPSDEEQRARWEELASEEGRGRALREAIARLEEPAREILLLLVDRELKLEEIAKLTGIPLNTVKSHIHRAKAKLRTAMAEEQEEA